MNTADHNPIAATDYLVALGLQQHPYLESSDARFFYADPVLVQRLDLLQHLTQFGDMLLGVTGPVGSGKTTLAQQFLLRGNTAWRSCRLDGAHIQQPSELLAKLAECLGLQAAATPERLKADLIRHCQTLRHNTQIAVVVIDDAQQLPDLALKALLELADDPRATLKLLRVILFSEAGLEQRLAATGWHTPQQPLLHNLDIPRFDEQQTAAYLMYRLAVAGYSGESPFSLTEIRALHKATDGLPGKLNVLAHETLIERAGRIASRNKSAAPDSRRARPGMLLGLVGSLVVGGLAWYLSQEQTAHKPLAPAPPLELAESTASAPPKTPVASPKPELVSPVPPAAPVATPKEEPEKSLETTLETQQNAEVKAEIKIESLAKPIPEPAQLANPTNPTTVAKSTPPTDSAQPKPEPSPAIKPKPPEKSPLVPTTATVATPPPPAIEPKPAPKPSQPVASPAATGSKQLGTDWLQSRPGSRFTLQLLGGRSEKSLHDYLRQHRIPEPIATFRTVFKGGDWYVLVHGDFPSMTAARAAVATLPATVRKGKPWARNFASVHTDMQKARP